MDIKKILLIFAGVVIVGLLLGGIILFSNEQKISYDTTSPTIKTYDRQNQEVTIKDIGNSTDIISKVKLNTPLVNYVIRGKDRLVAEFTIESFKEFDSALSSSIDFYDLKQASQKIDRTFTYKYKVITGTRDVPVYKEVCVDDSKNLTSGRLCTQEIVETKKEDVYGWNAFNEKAILPKGNITIGIFTDVLPNDNVEWQPTLFGEKITEWAVWTDSLNVGLMLYFPFDNGSSMFDSLKFETNLGTPAYGSFSCKNGNCLNATDSATVGAGGNVFSNQTQGDFWDMDAYRTINFWVFVEDKTANNWILHLGDEYFISDATGYYGAGICNGYAGKVTAGAWDMITIKSNATGNFCYVNASMGRFFAVNPNWAGRTVNISFSQGSSNIIDEMGVWNRSLSDAEIVDLYNARTGIFYEPTVLDKDYPQFTDYWDNNGTQYDGGIGRFNVTVTSTNGTVFFKYNNTNYTASNNSGNPTTFNVTLTGLTNGTYSYNWTSWGNGTSINVNISAGIKYTILNTPIPIVTLFSPDNKTNFTTGTISFNCSGQIKEVLKINNVSLWINGIKNYTLPSGTGNFTELYRTLDMSDGVYNWTCSANDNSSTPQNAWAAANRTFMIDTISPILTNALNLTNLTTLTIPVNSTWNYSATDTNMGGCYYNTSDASATQTITCNSTIETEWAAGGDKTIWYYANDTFGHVSYKTQNLTITYISYWQNDSQDQVTELETVKYYLNVTTTTVKPVSAYLWLNHSLYTPSVTINSSSSYNFTVSLIVPKGWGNTTGNNITWYWNYSVENIAYNLSTTVSDTTFFKVILDNCTAGTTQLMNLSVFDEDSQAMLDAGTDNVSIKVDFSLKTTSNVLVANYSKAFSYVNPIRICYNLNSINSSSYRLDGVIEYSSNDRFVEFYNFQNYIFNVSTANLSLKLYDLNSTRGQAYKITYKDSNFVPVEGALLNIQRKYIEEGQFKTIELPKTGSEGYTIGHLITSNVIYNIFVFKDGVLLGTFLDIVASCQIPALQECNINLNSYSSSIMPREFSYSNDIIFTLTYNKTSRRISSISSIPSGGSSTVLLNATLFDNLGGTQVCSHSYTSAGGTLSCTVPNSFGNATVVASLYKDGTLVGRSIISLAQNPSSLYGLNLIFIGLIAIIIIIGISITDNPMTYGIMFILGLIVLITLNIVYSPSVIGVGATVLWLIVSIILILIKGSNRQ